MLPLVHPNYLFLQFSYSKWSVNFNCQYWNMYILYTVEHVGLDSAIPYNNQHFADILSGE